MNKNRKVLMIIAIFVMTIICTSSVYAGGPAPIKFEPQNRGITINDETVGCLYEGDTIIADVIIDPEEVDMEITDFEIEAFAPSKGLSAGVCPTITSNFKDAVFSNDKSKLYYIQIMEMASKNVIPVGTKLARLELKIPDNIFESLEQYMLERI